MNDAAPPPPSAHGPPFDRAAARRLAGERYGIRADATPLPGDRDLNYLLVAETGDRYVLKVSPAEEPGTRLDCRNAILERVSAALPEYRFPRLVPTQTGESTTTAVAGNGTPYAVRLLTFVSGVPLAAYRPHDAELLRGLGGMLGAVDRALVDFDHPAADTSHAWDPRRGREVVEAGIAMIDDPGRRSWIEAAIARCDTAMPRLLPRLRTSVIHGDGNDHNVLVDTAVDPLARRRARGLIDFGDAVRSWTVGEVAIATAYVMMGKADPLAAARAVVAGYHEAHPLAEPEIEAIYPLIVLRLCVSVVHAARGRRQRPGDAYLTISEEGAWALLERLTAASPDLAHYTFRAACGLEPCPHAARVTAWLRNHADRLAPVLARPAAEQTRVTFDLSVGSREAEGLDGSSPPGRWTDLLFDRMRAEDAALGIGRYGEVRVWNDSDAFRVETDDGPDWRAIHVGVDLFVPPGTEVRTPLAGRVASVRDNAGRHDYGPTVILEHRPADGTRFYTLYGHLSRRSIQELRAGADIEAGQTIAAVGDTTENGGWAPHLHLQLVADPLGHDGTFPGVARPSERDVWLSVSPDPNLLLQLPEGCAALAGSDAVLAARRSLIGSSLGVSYRRPLHIVRGARQYLYDADGRVYLDCVNNVAHVGHGHPAVIEALRRQATVLNTNTRYLHEKRIEYAQRLTATLPEPLRVCYFVCSGSEANELALRLARAHTGRRDLVVLEGAYHGNTTSLIEISPYKFHGPGGEGAPPHVWVAALPDPYRGPHRADDAEAGRRYAARVRRAVEASRDAGRGVAAFFVEPLPGCAGQIVPPPGYLAEAFRHVREAGGVCVADEVQVGFGRVGTHFWGFETQDAVPDIVTLGKPIGNGHPLGAVVTTPEIAASFDNGMEYFNTFGGNPVSCAVGLAVLDVIEREGLRDHARGVGDRLLAGLRGLMDRHPLIGDVRGRGLFLGVELVLDRESLEPAPRRAAYLVERLRERGVLLSTDGLLRNVLKVKPPLVFDEDDADRLVETLDAVLGETPVRSGSEEFCGTSVPDRSSSTWKRGSSRRPSRNQSRSASKP